GLIGLLGAVPFQQHEFGMVQRATLAVAKDAGEIEDAPLAGGEQLLAGELRRSVEIERRAGTVRRLEPRRERMHVRFVAGRYLQRRRLNLDEIPLGEEAAQRRLDPS